MTRFRANTPFAADHHYRDRATRRRIGTNLATAAMLGLVALLIAAMIYVVILVLTLLADTLGAQANGRIEQRYRSGANAAVEAMAVLPHR